jgi:hypothetical protein
MIDQPCTCELYGTFDPDCEKHNPTCAICGEVLYDTDERAEMVPPANAGAGHLVHAQCGISAGWEIA